MTNVNLSNGEWKIMQALWQTSPQTITQLTFCLKEDTGRSKHTIITMLGRMESKGVVRYEEGERAKLFYPTITKKNKSIEEAKKFLKRVYSGSVNMMVNSLVEEKSLSKKEIEELYEILKCAKEK